MKKTFLTILIMTAALSTGIAAAESDAGIVASLKLLTPYEIKSGDPVIVSYDIENRSDSTIILPAHFFGTGATDGTGLFFAILDENRQPLSSKCPPRSVEYPEATISLRPGEFHGIKAYAISDCFDFPDGHEFTISAEFSSTAQAENVWSGGITTNVTNIKVKESDDRKKTRIADALLAQWLTNYDYRSTTAFKQKLLSLGTPAVPAVAAALERERRPLPANDLLEILSQLPCQESIRALIEFLKAAPDRQFVSNIPNEFTSGGLLVDPALRALEKISTEKFDRNDGNLVEQWESWMVKNIDTFPRAVLKP